MNEQTPDFGQTKYSVSPEEFEYLAGCINSNNGERGAALEVFTSHYPCELKKVLCLWLPLLDQIIGGLNTWDKYVEYVKGLGHWIKIKEK